MDEVTELQRLRSELADHPGSAVVDALDSLERAFGILERNLEELVDTLNAATDWQQSSHAWVHAGQRDGTSDKVLDEIVRRLHNVVAAMTMLRDHTKWLVRDQLPKDSPQRKVFERNRDKWKSTPVICFVERLRDYTLHHALPAVGQHTSLTTSTLELTIYIDRDKLLAAKTWFKDRGREYLAAAPETIDLRDPVLRSAASAAAFHDSARQLIVEHHRTVLAEWDELAAACNELGHRLEAELLAGND